MTSEQIIVWVWLPEAEAPVPAGALTGGRNSMSFRYGNKYLLRPDAVSLSPTLPLTDEASQRTSFPPTGDMPLPSAIRDAAPDAWGRRVIMNLLRAGRGFTADTADLDEPTYLLHSDSDRIGALDFQRSAEHYVARGSHTSITDMQDASDRISRGEEIPESLRAALASGTGIGGARPKGLVEISNVPSLIKFSVSTDVFPSIEAEALATNLAHRVGLRASTVKAQIIAGRYALVAERFDRVAGTRQRKMVVSALTITGRDEITSRYSSYGELIEKLRPIATDPASIGPELFDRVAFNMMISNGDDHLRNHAAFWNGKAASLTPAYDLAPGRRREGAEMTLTLPYGADGTNVADLQMLANNAHVFSLSRRQAQQQIENMRRTIETEFAEAADEMQLPRGTVNIIRSCFLHDTAVRNLPTTHSINFSPKSEL